MSDVYEAKKSLPNKLLQDDGTITDFEGNIVESSSEEYDSKRAIPNKLLNPDGTYSTFTEVLAKLMDTALFVVVDELPEVGLENKIYLLDTGAAGLDEYVYVEGEWHKMGEMTLDLSDYTTTEEVEQMIKSKGYLIEESDPTVPKHVKDITEQNINDWNSKVAEESDPTVPTHVKNIKESDIDNWNNEEDPTVPKHVKDITEENIENWNEKVETETLDKRVKMFHATIDNSSFQYVKGSADFTYADVANVESCIIEVAIANEKMYLIKQEFKNINPPDPIAGRYVGFSNMIRTAGEMAEIFLFVYDPENLPTDEASLKRLETWGDYQYCQSSYQPVMMGNFLGKDIAAERNRDNLAPSMKASGDYTDAKCGVVLDYMQTTFAENIMTLIANAYTKKPVIIYDNPTGFEASNSNVGDDWHLTGLNLSPYKRLKFYVCSDGSSNDNYTPSHVVEMHLDSRCTKHKGMYTAGHTAQNPNNGNRLHNVTFAVNGEKTAIQFARATSLYGTASTASAGGRYCYLIEGYYD
jgi:hypothetical protein